MALADQWRSTASPGIRRIENPLDLIAEADFRQRRLLGDLDQIGRYDAPECSTVRELMAFFHREYEAQMQDEDDDLLPLLRRRAEPDDVVERVISRLGDDHSAGRARAAQPRDALVRRLELGAAPIVGGRALIARHVAEERRRLISENAIILPLGVLLEEASDA